MTAGDDQSSPEVAAAADVKEGREADKVLEEVKRAVGKYAQQEAPTVISTRNGGETWEVVGGIGKGGIIVRSGRHIGSAVEVERLSTGACVQQLELDGDRLFYKLVVGTGPRYGWVTTKLGEKELVVPMSLGLQDGQACETEESSLQKLWRRLRRCGRLPVETPSLLAPTLRVWLGDYGTAVRRCVDEGLEESLSKFVSDLSAAQNASRAFHPSAASRESLQNKEAAGVDVAHGVFMTEDDVKVGYVCLSPPQSALRADAPPAVLLRFGGNDERAAFAAHVDRGIHRPSPYRDVVNSGVAYVFFIDYRGYGWSGGEPSLANMRGDADAFFRAMPAIFEQHGLQWPHAGPLIVMGRSIGTFCALHLAVLYPGSVAGLLLDSPVSCHWPHERMIAGRWDALGRWFPPLVETGRTLVHCPCCSVGSGAQRARMRVWLDPHDLLRCVDMPLLMINGTQDPLCPRPQAENLFSAAAARNKRLVWLRDKGHDDVLYAPDYWQAISDFLTRLVLEKGGVASTGKKSL